MTVEKNLNTEHKLDKDRFSKDIKKDILKQDIESAEVKMKSEVCSKVNEIP